MSQYRLFLNGFWVNADYFNENDFETNPIFYFLRLICSARTGDSMLVIGSAAGVAPVGM